MAQAFICDSIIHESQTDRSERTRSLESLEDIFKAFIGEFLATILRLNLQCDQNHLQFQVNINRLQQTKSLKSFSETFETFICQFHTVVKVQFDRLQRTQPFETPTKSFQGFISQLPTTIIIIMIMIRDFFVFPSPYNLPLSIKI